MGATENGNIITGSWDCTLKVWRIVPARQFNSVLIGKKPEEPLDYRSIGSNGSGSAEGNKIFQEELGHGNWGSSGQNRHPDASSSSCFVKEQWVGDGRVELEQVCVIETSHPVECLSVVGDHVLVGGRGTSSLFVYSLSSRKLLTTLCLNLHNPTPTAQFTAVDSCENIVAASQKDCIFKLFKDRSGSDIDVIHQQYSASTNSPAASASRWWLIETCALGSVTVWEVLLCSSAQSSNDERAVRVSRAAVSSSPASTRSRASNSHSQPPDLSGPLVFDCVLLGRVNCYGSFATIPGINSTQIRESYPHRPGAIRFPMWDVLCGFKDGNIRGWRVRPTSASSANSVEVVETGCFCSLGDWITWLDEDAVADIVVAGAWDGMIRVWDKRKKALRRSLVSNVKSAVLCLVRVNEILVVGNYNGSLIAFDFGRK
ncbi:hypothetical protein HDU83_002994 [Entophlyctis luteolus]|nr:hypothetical protein HDU83_002994 [Entophlyctis luteolus]